MAQMLTVDGRTYLVDDAGVAHPVEASSAPAAPVAASPFAAASIVSASAGKVDTTPEPLRGASQHDARRIAAVLAIPLYSCTVDAVYTVPGEPEPRTGALHGFAFAHKAGEPCTGVRGIAKGESCPGVIRA